MKIQFKQQQYQEDAVNALTRVFSGQEKGFRKETVGRSSLFVDEIFSNKKLTLAESNILKNVQELQREQGIPVVKKLEKGLNFTVEMETGTGKTYVYTKMMFEMHKQYGWNKFIIMVPSVAIREGVHKSLEITADHFQELYGKKIRFSIYDTKNKSNLINIQKFGNSAEIEVLIMNYQAFGTSSESARKIFEPLDQLQSKKPIDVINRTRPILIIDEPQRFGPTAENKLHKFDPLFITRFSATHREDYNKVYRLDAIDAFNQKLVKKIKVKGIEVRENLGTNSFLYLDRINVRPNANPTATIELEIGQAKTTTKKLRTVSEGDNLFDLSGELAQYDGYVVSEIRGDKNTVTFTNGVSLIVGQVSNDPSEEHVRRIQIRETIKSHIEKERELFSKGIKVLSLFFIDEVAKYRAYDESGNQIKSEYEIIFEEEYQNAIAEKTLFHDAYNTYLEKHSVEEVHNGYFSIDKKGKAINSREARGQGGSDDISAYDLIMKDKERLLSFKESTRFIFSHSALREGWDNPNIFQICTLKHSDSTISKRQEIGRGLRICVDEHGERMDHGALGSEFFDINALTVVASESYDSFASQLQKEILNSISGRPSKLEVSVLKDRQLKNTSGETFTFDEAAAMRLIMKFTAKGYVDETFNITETLVEAIETNTLEVPDELENFKEELSEVLTKIHATNSFKSTENELASNLPKEFSPNENFAKKEFQTLWNKIKVKTIYDVDFDSGELIQKSIAAIDRTLQVRKVSVQITGGGQEEELSEVSLREGKSLTKTDSQLLETVSILGSVTYDVVADIAKHAHITRKTSVKILAGINKGSFAQFTMNPEHFIKEVSRLINEQKATTLINNITYHKTQEVYEDDIFTINNFNGSLQENVLEVKRHIYDYVKTDSQVERTFAQALETGEVSVYAKLPAGFKIPTPVGNYNPDWAIVFDTPDVKYVYFIAETKGSMSTMQLSTLEDLKISYARKHFESLGNKDVKYDVVNTYDDLRQKVMM